MDQTYRQARELGVETNLAELEAFGFTVVPPEKNGASKDFAARLMDKVAHFAAAEDTSNVDLNKHENRPAYGRQLFHLLAKDPVFIEAAMNPVVRTFGAYLLGSSYLLYSMVAFLKDPPMHCDSVGVPTPLPFYGSVCNVSWILTDYTVENGTLGMVPGSHRFCRHPTDFEQPKFVGGPMDEAMVTPVAAEPGSLVIFHGNTWHCTYPKTSETARAHVATAFCRNYINPAEDYSDLDPKLIEPHGAELARLIGHKAWQLENMMLVRPAYQTMYG